MTTSKKYLIAIYFLINILILANPSIVKASTSVDRIAGYDRYETATAISQNGWPDGADSAILAYGENFPDALSAGPLAHKYNCPILLTESSSLNENTAQELTRLNVKKVYIVGGTAVISKNIENQLSAMKISPTRIAGQDCYDTAIKIAQTVGISKGIFVTTGLDFSDALSAAPIAAAKSMPIILVPRDQLTSGLKTFVSKSKIPTTYVVTGNNEISNSIISQFPNSEVISGADPYTRNINVINKFAADLDLSTIYAATGASFPDALSASALAQKGQHPLILLNNDTLPASTQVFIHGSLISQIYILGGSSVISDSMETKLAGLPAQIKSVANVHQTIEEKQKYTPPATVEVTITNDTTEQVPVTWVLSSVNTLQAGTYKFQGTVQGYDSPVYLYLTVNPIVSKFINVTDQILLGDAYSLPNEVTATMSDGSQEKYPVTWSSSNTVALDKAGTFTFQGTVTGETQKVTLTLKVLEDAKIDFPDQNLKDLIADKVGKDSDESIYLSDVKDITNLYARSRDITDLTGIQYLTNLRSLDVRTNNLTKVPSLSALTHLTTLKMHKTGIKDLSALKGLTSLTYLDISDNYITDFSPLKDFTNLTWLYLSDNFPSTLTKNYTPDYSPVRSYYSKLTHKDFKL